MMRERLGRAALHAFPETVRASRGEEMLGTLLDVSANSRSRFVLEIIALVGAGLTARAIESAKPGARRMLADGVCLAAIVLLTMFVSTDLGDRIRGNPWSPSSPWPHILAGAALILALIGYDRLAGATALLFTASLAVSSGHNGGNVTVGAFGICASALLLTPRRHQPDVRRLTWLIVTAGVALIASTSDDTSAAPVILAVLVLAPVALALLPVDPRPAIACALLAAWFGIVLTQKNSETFVPGLIFMAAAAVIVAIGTARVHRLQTHTPV